MSLSPLSFSIPHKIHFPEGEITFCVKLIFIGILLLKTSHIWTGPTVAVCDMITRWMISFCATSMLHVITDKGCEIPESWSWSLCNLCLTVIKCQTAGNPLLAAVHFPQLSVNISFYLHELSFSLSAWECAGECSRNNFSDWNASLVSFWLVKQIKLNFDSWHIHPVAQPSPHVILWLMV